MTRPFWIPVRVLFVATAFGLFFGCDRGAQSPQERAYYLFVHSQFGAAVQACDEALDSTDQPQELADLHLLRGRCFVEQADHLQKAGEDGSAIAKLEDADAAFTLSIETLKGAEAHYYRSLVHEMMGNEELALKDGEIARKLDESYPMAYINEPVEELIDLRRPDEDKNEQVDPQAQAAADGPSTGVTVEATVEGDRFDGTGLATEATRTRAPVATPGPTAGIPVLQRQSLGNLTSKSDQGRSSQYRGQPPSAGELSTAVPRTQTGPQMRHPEAAARQGFGTGQTFTVEDGLSDSSGRSESQAAEDEDLTDDSADAPSSEEDPADEPTQSPRAPVIWPPPVGPWSVTGQPPGRSLPTTGLGGAPAWGSTPNSAGVPMQQVPTTGIVGPPGLKMQTQTQMQSPWSMGWGVGGALASPFATPTTGIGGIGWPTTQVGPGVPLAPAATGPAMMPTTRPGVGLQGPMVGPTPTQSLPTTGVQRTVSPYPR